MKALIGIIALVIVLGVVVFGLVLLQFKPTEEIISLGTPAPTSTPIETLEPTETGSGSGVQTGTIEGKLCFPSEFLPAGSIEAKNTINQAVVSQFFGGTESGEGNAYSLAVPAGNYILRYKTDGGLSGYHTDICPTGGETTCAGENERQHIGVVITNGKTVSDIDLCDFYYSAETEPIF
jgi:hypothetical protein